MNNLVVSNSGPLMVFSKLNLLHLLKKLYGEVLFPKAVYEEVVVDGIKHGFEDAYSLRLFLKQNNWKPQEVCEIHKVIASSNLDKGEKEAIVLALSKKAMLLMDEELGRSIARQTGLKVKGSLGVLIEALHKNLINIEQLRFYFAQISMRNDIWISSKLCKQLLEKIDLNPV